MAVGGSDDGGLDVPARSGVLMLEALVGAVEMLFGPNPFDTLRRIWKASKDA